jgi:hypothetical protein
MAATFLGMTGGQMTGVAGLISAYGESEAQKAAGIQEQTGLLLRARDTLAVAEVRAEMSNQYATIQAGRILKRAEIESQNYRIAGNQLLKNLRSVNASARARAAASGIAYGEGSAAAVEIQNTRNVMFDVGVADLNALAAQVMGFEDASAMIESTQYQGMLDLFAANRQADQYTKAGKSARDTSGLLANFTLTKGIVSAGKTFI